MLSSEVLEDLNRYPIDYKGFVVMSGDNGRGKSYVARKIYQRVATFQLPARDYDEAWFINQAELNILFAEHNEKYGSSSVLFKQMCDCKLFILDDLATRTPSAAFLDLLYATIDWRWENRENLSTIITTNKSSSDLRKIMGDAIVSRMCSGRNYKVVGPDHRTKNEAI